MDGILVVLKWYLIFCVVITLIQYVRITQILIKAMKKECLKEDNL